MAVLTYRKTKTTVTDREQIAKALADIGIGFETWGVERLPEHLRSRNLADTEKQDVLTAFKPELERMKSQGGYVTADVVSLWPDTPNLDVMLAKFDKKHLHTEDEVRFCVQGRGVFTVFPQGTDALDIELRPGDFISVPANYHHEFRLCDDRKITAIRLFRDPAGWVAHYVN
ncbi:MAG: cupin domain-containing protein [Planctomycetes bacterium]|nr:cupin domain-containing protein [Planctomycetota bacterium]